MPGSFLSLCRTNIKQEAELSQRYRAILRVIGYFAESLEDTHMSGSRIVSEIFSVK